MKLILYIKIILISYILCVYSYAEDMVDHGVIQESKTYNTKGGYKLFLGKNYSYTVYKNGALQFRANKLLLSGARNQLSVLKFNQAIVNNLKEAAIEKMNHLIKLNNSFKFSKIKKINNIKLRVNYSNISIEDNIEMQGIIVFIQNKRNLLALDVSTRSNVYIKQKNEIEKIANSFQLHL